MNFAVVILEKSIICCVVTVIFVRFIPNLNSPSMPKGSISTKDLNNKIYQLQVYYSLKRMNRNIVYFGTH